MRIKRFFVVTFFLMATYAFAQTPPTGSGTITGKYGTYYDQRELLFETLPTSENDIIFLGNSITDGGEWCELFQNPNCKNRGISGDIAHGVLHRLETITKGQPAMVFLMIGTNDMSWGISNDTVALNVHQVVQRIKRDSPRTRIVLQSILPTNDCYGLFKNHTQRWQDVAVINGMLKAIAEEEQIEYLDLYSRFATEEGKMNPKYSNDGLHINGEGYRLWKEMVEDEIGRLPQPVRKSKAPVWLDFSLGGNIANCYDNGTIPFNYTGFGGNVGFGVTVEWRRCHVQTETRVFGNLLTQVNGTGIGVESQTEFLYRFHDSSRNRWHLWAGGGLQGYLDVKEIAPLLNASTGVSLFENLCAKSMAQYDFAFIRGGAHNLLSVYGKLTLPLVGLAMRPGYAYMDNYTQDIHTDNTQLSNYELFGKWFPGLSTDVGLYLNLLNGNRIGLNYRWDYLSTGHKGSHRFDNTFHSVNVSFMFKLN